MTFGTSNYAIEITEGHFDASNIYLRVRNNSWSKPANAQGKAYALLSADGLSRTNLTLSQAQGTLGDRGKYLTEMPPNPMISGNLQGNWATSGPGAGYYLLEIPDVGNSVDVQIPINWDNLLDASLNIAGETVLRISKIGYDSTPITLRKIKIDFPEGVLYYTSATAYRLVKPNINSLIISRT